MIDLNLSGKRAVVTGASLGIGAAKCFDASTDLREQVARFELEVVAVDLNHGIGSYFCGASCRVGSSIR